MKKTLLIIILLPIYTFSQTVIDINSTLGNSIINKPSERNIFNVDKITPGNSFLINSNILLSKRKFQPKFGLSYSQVNFSELSQLTFASNLYNPAQLTTKIQMHIISINIGGRYYILNNKNKLFTELNLATNYILSAKSTRMPLEVSGEQLPKLTTNYSPSVPVYISAPIKIGYQYKNYFSVAAYFEAGLTPIDNINKPKVFIYGLNFGYLLPILGNKKTPQAIN